MGAAENGVREKRTAGDESRGLQAGASRRRRKNMGNKRREWKRRRKNRDGYRVTALVCLIAAALMVAAGGLWLAVNEKEAVFAVWAESDGGSGTDRGPEDGGGTEAAEEADGKGTADGQTMSGEENAEGAAGSQKVSGKADAEETVGGQKVSGEADAEKTVGGQKVSGEADAEGTLGGQKVTGGTETAGAPDGENGVKAQGSDPAKGATGTLNGGLPGNGETVGTANRSSEVMQMLGAQDSLLAQGQAFRAGRPKVKGIYVTGAMAGTANMDNLIDLVDRTELNALVIDVKNDEGYVVCDMDAPLVSEVGSVRRYVKDMLELIRKCKEKGIYLIARIVAFKDPVLAEAKPEWSLHNADGTIFRDKSGLAWVNPYEEQVWAYLLQVAQGAVVMGFDEIQFDYVRFSTDSGMKQVDFGPKAALRSREEAIEAFVAYASDALHQMGAAVSADVYGVVIDSRTDQQIVGQNYVNLAAHLDYLSPMVYPSHYGPYNYNIPIPDAQPYDTVLAAMQASRMVMAGIDPKQKSGNDPAGSGTGSAAGGKADSTGGAAAGDGVNSIEGVVSAEEANSAAGKISEGDETSGAGTVPENSVPAAPAIRSAAQIAALSPMDTVRASVRPWLQDFTATWVKGHIKYGPEQIRAQIQAVYDAGYEEWILWNASNRYTEGGLLPETQE